MTKPTVLKKFKFTTNKLHSLPINDKASTSTDLEFSDSEVIGLKLLSGKKNSKRFLFRYRYQGRKGSIGIGSFPDIDLATARKVASEKTPFEEIYEDILAMNHNGMLNKS